MGSQFANSDTAYEMPERRAATRFPVHWPIKIRGVDNTGRSFEECGELANLSSRGALVHVDRDLPVGCQADVLIRVPLRGQSWMKFPATVIRVEGEPITPWVGLEFSTYRPQFLIE